MRFHVDGICTLACIDCYIFVPFREEKAFAEEDLEKTKATREEEAR